MTKTEESIRVDRVMDSVRDAEDSGLEAVRKFVDTVNGIFPDLSEDGPRTKIIDSAFKMTEELVGASTNLADKIMKALTEGVERPNTETTG
jgi:hypothetical protein